MGPVIPYILSADSREPGSKAKRGSPIPLPGEAMRFLVISDIHMRDRVKVWANRLIEEHAADGVIVLGDITHFGPPQWAAEFRHRGKDLLCEWNSIDASYFAKHIFYTKDHGWSASPVETLNYLESHDEDSLGYLFGLKSYSADTQRYKTKLGAVTLACSLGVPMLMEDLKLKSLPACGLDSQSVEHLTVIERAITLSQQNLQADPLLLAGQLIARLGDLGNPAIADLLDQAGRWTKAPWIRPLR